MLALAALCVDMVVERMPCAKEVAAVLALRHPIKRMVHNRGLCISSGGHLPILLLLLRQMLAILMPTAWEMKCCPHSAHSNFSRRTS